MSNEHVSTWTASVYTVNVTMFPRGSACVYIVHVAFMIYETGIRNNFAKTRRIVLNSMSTVCNVRSCSAHLSQRIEHKYYHLK